MAEPFRYIGAYSALPVERLRLVAERMFAARNYVLAIAVLEAMEEALSAVERGKLAYARVHVLEADARFGGTGSVMPILFRGYGAEAVAEVLGVRFGDAAVRPGERLVQVVYKPSFDPEVMLSLSEKEGRTTLSLDAASELLWNLVYVAQDPDYARSLPSGYLPPPVSVCREEMVLDGEDAERLWGKIGEIDLEEPEREIISIDGMSVEGCFRDGRVHDFQVPVVRGGPGVELARLLFENASERLVRPGSESALENLFGYLPGADLPIKDRPGPPRTLRMFGRLGWSSQVVSRLREVLSTISRDEPLIVDLSNFRGMGTLLHAELAPLVERRGPTAWIRSPGADPHLRDLSIDPSCIVETIAAAKAHVREPSSPHLSGVPRLSGARVSTPEPTHAEEPPGGPPDTFQIGRYRVVGELGAGGTATVYLARRDEPAGFQSWVAVKRLHPRLAANAQIVDMFLDEMRIAAGLEHPNVVRVLDIGKEDGTYWMAMEYIHGEPLSEAIQCAEEQHLAIAPEVAARLCAEAAEGLHAAHELTGKKGQSLGVVHRDVTPQNLMLTYDGHIKVFDFGIAKAAERLSSTSPGTLKGRLAYMSPEQVRGMKLDRTADIFALGVVLWELITSRRLFQMDTDLDTLEKVTDCVVPRPSSLVADCPVDLENIVMKALAKAKQDRFQTARELSGALRKLLVRRAALAGAPDVELWTRRIFGDRIRKREAILAGAT